MFRDMSSKIDVFFEYREWENEHKISNGVIGNLEMFLGVSIRGG